MPMAFLIDLAAVASTATGLSGSLRLPSRVTVAAMSSARSPGCNLKPSFNRVPQGRFRGSRLTETDMGTGSTLARVLPALRVLPVLSLTMFTAAAQREGSPRGAHWVKITSFEISTP